MADMEEGPGFDCARTVSERLASFVTSGRAAWKFGRAAYDGLYFVIPATSRGRWGALLRFLLGGWDRVEDLLAALALIEQSVEELVAVAERAKPDKLVVVNVAAGFSIVGILRAAVLRRVAELRDAHADAATGTGDSTGGGGLTDGAEVCGAP